MTGSAKLETRGRPAAHGWAKSVDLALSMSSEDTGAAVGLVQPCAATQPQAVPWCSRLPTFE